MKKTTKFVCAVGGAIAVRAVIGMAFYAGMGWLMGVALANQNTELITAEDVADILRKDGFSINRLSYLAGVAIGQEEKDLAKEIFKD